MPGRWGSIEHAEKFLNERGQAKLQPVLNAALSKAIKSLKIEKPNSKAEENTAPNSNLASLDGVDDVKTYQVKMSRWIGATIHAANDIVFWVVLRSVIHIRAPLSHFMNYLQQSGGKNMKELVTTKLIEFQNEFAAMAASFNSWFRQLLTDCGCASMAKEMCMIGVHAV